MDRGDKRRAEQAPACSLRAPPRPSSPLDCVQRRALTAAQPDRLALHLNIAACALRTADYDNAVFHATRALRTDPKNVKALFRRASAAVSLRLAAPACRRERLIGGGISAAGAHLAKAGDVNGLEAALADLGRARELDPDNRDAPLTWRTGWAGAAPHAPAPWVGGGQAGRGEETAKGGRQGRGLRLFEDGAAGGGYLLVRNSVSDQVLLEWVRMTPQTTQRLRHTFTHTYRNI